MPQEKQLYRFAAAAIAPTTPSSNAVRAQTSAETNVFGASRPGYGDAEVQAWIAWMRSQSIQRVCCLLEAQQVARYSDLLGMYRQAFGEQRVCWTPIADFQLVDRSRLLNEILPFLQAAERQGEKVVVHCAGGVGRTGQVLAAWLVYRYGWSNRVAIAAVRQTGRNPYEAVLASLLLQGKNPLKTLQELHRLLDACRQEN